MQIQIIQRIVTRSRSTATERRSPSRPLVIGAVAFALAATACGANEDETEPTQVIQEEFTVESCAVASPDKVFAGKIAPADVSPRSLTTCFGGYVVDVTQLSAAYTGDGNHMDARIAIHYADTPITSQSTCENTRVVGVFYEERVNNGTTSDGGFVPPYWHPIKSETDYGTWVPVFGGSCTFEVNLMGMVPLESYRIAATARTPGNNTRKVSIGTYKPINVQ